MTNFLIALQEMKKVFPTGTGISSAGLIMQLGWYPDEAQKVLDTGVLVGWLKIEDDFYSFTDIYMNQEKEKEGRERENLIKAHNDLINMVLKIGTPQSITNIKNMLVANNIVGIMQSKLILRVETCWHKKQRGTYFLYYPEIIR